MNKLDQWPVPPITAGLATGLSTVFRFAVGRPSASALAACRLRSVGTD
ncbi:hypothetical protein [Streptomyces sp. NPDC101776]